jgi:hypothetical protein
MVAKRALTVLYLIVLCGCVSSHDFYLVGRKSGVTGIATVPANDDGGPIKITLGNKVYEGRWLFMEARAGVGFASGSAPGLAAPTTGTFAGLPSGDNGTVIAAAADGSTLRCTFYFSEWNLKGVGVCQDKSGETYDLQINSPTAGLSLPPAPDRWLSW